MKAKPSRTDLGEGEGEILGEGSKPHNTGYLELLLAGPEQGVLFV